MQQEMIFQLLKQIEDGKITAQEAMADIQMQPEMLVGNYADIDMHRALRQGMPEVIYGCLLYTSSGTEYSRSSDELSGICYEDGRRRRRVGHCASGFLFTI